jgi:hypothetical protein
LFSSLADVIMEFAKARGTTPPVVSPAQIPQPPAAPVPPIFGQLPQPVVAPMLPAPSPLGLYASGFEFRTPEAARAAGVASVGQAVTELISRFKQKHEAHQRAEAYNEMQQIVSAMQRGDRLTLEALLSDPKRVKRLEKALDWHFPRTSDIPPDVQGAAQALAEAEQQGRLIRMRGTKDAIILPPATQAEQMQNIVAARAREAVEKDPRLAATLGVGTALTGSELRAAEIAQAGFGFTPKEWFALDQSERMGLLDVLRKVSEDQVKSEVELEKARMAAEGRIEAAKIGALSREQYARILANSREQIVKHLYGVKNLQNARLQAAKLYNSQITNLNSIISTLEKLPPERKTKDVQDTIKRLKDQVEELKATQEYFINLGTSGAQDQEIDVFKLLGISDEPPGE